MANPTTNYGFVLPTSTDLVTDLPADFDIALQGVDTRLKALQPGTTLGDIAYSSATANTNTRLPIGTSGQVLAVSGGGVPAWTTTADVTPLTTKGDLFTFTTADARLGVGTDGQTLVADSSTATGLKWATAASGGKVLQMVTATTTTPASSTSTSWTDTGLSATITPSATSSKILAMFYQMGAKGGSNVDNGLNIQILRGATQILIAQDIAYTGTNISNVAATNLLYVDSPSTTSATTYKTQFRSSISGSTTSVNSNSNIAVVVLLEIGA